MFVVSTYILFQFVEIISNNYVLGNEHISLQSFPRSRYSHRWSNKNADMKQIEDFIRTTSTTTPNYLPSHYQSTPNNNIIFDELLHSYSTEYEY